MIEVEIDEELIVDCLTTGHCFNTLGEKITVLKGLPPGCRLASVVKHEYLPAWRLLFNVVGQDPNVIEPVDVLFRKEPRHESFDSEC